jgi:ABC-type uncharacterized transport system involved in gliding motility auxiliary subunit
MHTAVKGNSERFVTILCRYSKCFICYPAHITISVLVKHFGIKAVHSLQSLFILSPSSYSGLWALSAYKPYLLQTSTGKMQQESDLEITWKMWRPGSGPSTAKPSLRQLPIQEHCHLIADM